MKPNWGTQLHIYTSGDPHWGYDHFPKSSKHCPLLPLLLAYLISQATKQIDKNFQETYFHERRKHLEDDHHVLKENVEVNDIHSIFVRSGHQLADLFTKMHGKSRLQ